MNKLSHCSLKCSSVNGIGSIFLFYYLKRVGNNTTAPAPVPVIRTEEYCSEQYSLKLEYHQNERGDFVLKHARASRIPFGGGRRKFEKTQVPSLGGRNTTTLSLKSFTFFQVTW